MRKMSVCWMLISHNTLLTAGSRSTGSRTPSVQGEFDEWELERDTRYEISQYMPVDADQEQECTCAECEALFAPRDTAPAGQRE